MEDTDFRTQIAERARNLIAASATASEEPAEDPAISAYLLLLALHDETLAEQLASTLPRNRPWWWARKIADRILSTSSQIAETASGTLRSSRRGD
jgi:hypothetical protein